LENQKVVSSAVNDKNLTEQQRNAVIHRGKTLLVSAGAGSGKTSTLSKRIISRITNPDDPVEIDDFLIVTFTNASAKDLSEKIERTVSEAVSKDIGNRKAMRQLSKIKYANISTISSFCLGVVRKHFQLLSLPAKLRICDGSEAELLLRRVTERVVEDMYAQSLDGAAFFDAVEIFSGSKNDEGFISLLQKLYKKIMSFPEPEKWCEKALCFYQEICEKDFLGTEYGKIAFEIIKSDIEAYIEGINSALERMENQEKYAKYVGIFSTDLDNAKCALSSLDIENYIKTSAAVSSVTTTRLTALPAKKYDYDELEVETIKSLRGDAYDTFNTHRKLFFGADQEKIKLAAGDCLKILSTVFDIVFMIDKRYKEEKYERGFIDFSDAERLTYRLFVKENDEETGKLEITDVAKKYRNSFAEIYIDEYQDINPIQDTIFRAICRYDENGYELNRFMVGDIKQSIYRFRGARPELFASYLQRFVRIGEEDSGCEHKEFLADNFRCSEGVVNFTNLIFSEIMRESYGEGDRLIYSKHESFKVDAPTEIVLFSPDEADEKDYYTDEMKATALKILEIVNNPSYISSDGKMYDYGDITVLLPKVKNVAEKYAKYFENCGIPAHSEVSENFFENAEILLCLCILNAIDNPLRDVYVTGAMRSEIFMFSDDDLLTIRRLSGGIAGSDESVWESVKAFADSDSDDDISLKCKKFVETIERFRKYSVGNSSDKLLLKLYSELHLMNVVSEKSFNRFTQSAPLRRENLMILYNLARNFEKTSFRGLCAFLEYLNDQAKDPKDIISASSSDTASAVRIMSVHHSKGLEFPVCFLCGLSSAFNKSDEQSSCIISDSLGVTFKLCDLPSVRSAESATSSVKFDTPFRAAVRHSELKLALEEQKRLLYVAMTRAKDRLVIMLEKVDKKALVSYYEKGRGGRNYISRANSFAGWIYPVISLYDRMNDQFDEIGFERSDIKADSNNSFTVTSVLSKAVYKNQKAETKEDDNGFSALSEDIKKRVLFNYPYRELSKVLSKISVSDIKNGKLKTGGSITPSSNDLLQPAFLDDTAKKPEEVGTAMHTFMQYADYKNCESDCYYEARRLLENGYITGEQFEMLDFDKLAEFFKSGVYAEISKAEFIKRESSFTINIPISEMYEHADDSVFENETMLIQGKIDCFFRDENGKFCIIDFKTDKVKDIRVLSERYSLQLYYYKRAVKEMTGLNDIRLVIYSFAHSDYIELEG